MQPDCVVSVVPDSAQDESIRQVLKSLIGERQYELWFRQKTRLVVEEGEVVVYAASPFHQKWLQKQHRAQLAQAARMVLGPSARLRFEVAPEHSPAADAAGTESTPATMPCSPAMAIAAERSGRPAPVSERSAAGPVRQGRRFADLSDFVVGPCNELALTAVRQACERPDGTCGPLFIYGPVGMGKTHLLEGLYREVRRKNPSWQVLFLTSEQFTNHFTQAYRDRTLPAFRQRFRTVDVLLVDDVDFLDAKRGIQEEFLHTWQQLESHGRLVIACGDRHPRLMTKVSDELKTRFLSGMVCRLEPPDLETRERIALVKAQQLDGDFSPEAIRYVARRFANSVRELEGALHCLQVYHRMTGKRVGMTAARQVLGDLERDCLRVVRMADIERAVCDLFGLEAAELKSARRARSVSEPRMLAMYLARRHTRAAYSEIGEYFGGRNHATVISADRKVAEWLAQDAQVKIASQSWRLADVLSTLEQQLLAG
ncbi:MAG: chromosomal replication initiator protein DnaA [Deltaproteobacteria bacterium]